MGPRAATKFLSEHVEHEAYPPASAGQLLSAEDVRGVAGDVQSSSIAAKLYQIWASTSEDWTSRAVDLIVRLRGLPENWDSYDARRITPDAVRVASTVLLAVGPYGVDVPSITPSPTGGIQLGWYSDRGEELELEVEASGDLSAYFYSPINESEWQGSVYDPQFLVYLRRMASNDD